MRMWKRAGIAALLTAAMVGIVTPAASAAPMPWETSTVTPAVRAALLSVGTLRRGSPARHARRRRTLQSNAPRHTTLPVASVISAWVEKRARSVLPDSRGPSAA